jgi:hypothetical protein
MIGLAVAGLFSDWHVIGVGYQKKWSWEVIIIISFGLVGMQSVSTLVVTATVVKNTFGVSFRLLILEDGRANSS